MSFETHPDYLAAKAEHLAAVQVARAAGDELAELRAENQWMQKSYTIRDRVAAEEAATVRRDTVLAQIKEQYPDVPESLLESIQDPDKLLAVAKDVAAKMTAAAPAPKGDGSWGATKGAPPGGSGSTTKGPRKSSDRAYVSNLIDRVNRNEGGKEGAVKEYKDMVWKERVMPWHDAGKNR